METIREFVDDQTSRRIRRHQAIVQSAGLPAKTSVDEIDANVDVSTEQGSATGNVRGTVRHTEVDEAKLEKRNQDLRTYAEDARYESRFTVGRLINGMFTEPIDLRPGETRHGIIRFEGKIRRRTFSLELPIAGKAFQFDVAKNDSPR